MVINLPPGETAKEYIFDNAIREAVTILLKPYGIIPDNDYANEKASKSEEIICEIYGAEQELSDRSLRENLLCKHRYFIVKMASIAWDFLNILNIFPREI